MTTIIASGRQHGEEQEQVHHQAAQQDGSRQKYVAEAPGREEAAVIAHMADRHIVTHIMVGAAGKGKGAIAFFRLFALRLVDGLRAFASPSTPPATASAPGPALIAATMLAPM